jgi:hypothetical protein
LFWRSARLLRPLVVLQTGSLSTTTVTIVPLSKPYPTFRVLTVDFASEFLTASLTDPSFLLSLLSIELSLLLTGTCVSTSSPFGENFPRLMSLSTEFLRANLAVFLFLLSNPGVLVRLCSVEEGIRATAHAIAVLSSLELAVELSLSLD